MYLLIEFMTKKSTSILQGQFHQLLWIFTSSSFLASLLNPSGEHPGMAQQEWGQLWRQMGLSLSALLPPSCVASGRPSSELISSLSSRDDVIYNTWWLQGGLGVRSVQHRAQHHTQHWPSQEAAQGRLLKGTLQ